MKPRAGICGYMLMMIIYPKSIIDTHTLKKEEKKKTKKERNTCGAVLY